jgi:alanyl-tRNA synthetase
MPQNEGRGYVLRRLLRRGARFGHLLGIKEPFLYKICDRVVAENAGAYPGLVENHDFIRTVIKQEEQRFSKTITQGMEMLQTIINSAETRLLASLDGADAFKLYDTFGFPLDLTREIAKDFGIDLDEEGFYAHMKAQQERARKARLESGGLGWEEDVLAGEDFEEVFVGYEHLSAKTQIIHVIKEGKITESIAEGEEGALLLEATPFYAESGGQAGDVGSITDGDGAVFEVKDTKKSPTGHIMHMGVMAQGKMAEGGCVTATLDPEARRAAMRNHTAAHLLQAALRQVLGGHAQQAGQYVDAKICRFDFNHFSAMEPDELLKVEEKVNDMILGAHLVNTREMSMEDAKKSGALAIFDGKYSDTVRVVDIAGWSMELCGGTHVKNTSELGIFRILNESSVAAGVRRIEALTGHGAIEHTAKQDVILQETCAALKVGAPGELPARAVQVMVQLKSAQRQLDEINQKLAGMEAQSIAENMPQVGPVRMITAVLGLETSDGLKAAADRLKEKHPDVVGVLAMPDKKNPGGKVTLLAFAGKDAVAAGIHAGKLVQAVAAKAGGSGGGRPDNAMGGITEPQKLEGGFAFLEEAVKGQLGIE